MNYYQEIRIEIPKQYVKTAREIMARLKPPETSISTFCSEVVYKVIEETISRKLQLPKAEPIKVNWFKKLINKILRREK